MKYKLKGKNKVITITSKRELVKATIITVIASIIFAWSIAWVLKPAGIYSTGLTGLLQLLSDILYKHFNFEMNFGLLALLANVPLIILANKKLNFRFSFLTTVSLITQSLFFMLPVAPVSSLELTSAIIFGGVVSGITSGVILKLGGSPGGIDIIAQYLSFIKNMSISKVFYSINLTIVIFIGILNDINTAVYTFIRTIITTQVIDYVHTSYKYLEVTITMNDMSNHSKSIVDYMGRGGTVYEARGAYQGTSKEVLSIVISSYELTRLKKLVLNIDEKAFITSHIVRLEAGSFKKKSI